MGDGIRMEGIGSSSVFPGLLAPGMMYSLPPEVGDPRGTRFTTGSRISGVFRNRRSIIPFCFTGRKVILNFSESNTREEFNTRLCSC